MFDVTLLFELVLFTFCADLHFCAVRRNLSFAYCVTQTQVYFIQFYFVFFAIIYEYLVSYRRTCIITVNRETSTYGFLHTCEIGAKFQNTEQVKGLKSNRCQPQYKILKISFTEMYNNNDICSYIVHCLKINTALLKTKS